MNVQLIPGRELNSETTHAWSELQRANPALESPYFAPEFTKAVAAERDDVRVAVIKEAAEIAAFFPFQVTRGSLGIPVGGILSDYHGLICHPGFSCDVRELVRRCGLVAWDFDHLLTSQKCWGPFHQASEPSPQMDLSRGYEVYVAERRAAGSEQIKKCSNLMRRLEREAGAVCFVAHSDDAGCLRQTFAWKSAQYRETGKPDLLAAGWIRKVVKRIHRTQTEGFAGMLSLLYAGDKLIAGHMGMRSRNAWHYWLPSYDTEMAKYSPGLILLLKMAERAPALGLRMIDLGKGMTLYKERLMNASVLLASGSVELPSWLAFRRGARRKVRGLVAKSAVAEPARRLVRWARNRVDQI